VIVDVGALTELDLATVDALARLQLTARRLGAVIELRNASRDVIELLAFAGLADVLPVEVDREIEERKEVRVDEVVDRADPTA